MNNCIDIDLGLSKSGNNWDHYLALLKCFYMEGQNRLERLIITYSSIQLNDYCILIHGIKSAAANIGAVSLSECARLQEEAVKQNNTEYMKQNADSIAIQYKELLETIKAVLKEHQIYTDGEDWILGEKTIERSALTQELCTILEQIDDFEPVNALVRLNGLKQYQLPPELVVTMRKLEQQIETYEYDQAVDLIRKLL